MVKVSVNGELIGVLRALCDTGSEANLIKRSAIKHFDSATRMVNGSVSGIAEDSVRIRRKITVTVQPWFSDGNANKVEANLMVLPKTSKWAPTFPSENVPCDVLSSKLKPNLADPWFWKANGVSLLLGIEFWATIIEGQSYKIGRSVLMQESLLGNLVCGRITSDDCDEPIESKEMQLVHVTGFNELEKTMRKFWEFEDLSLCSSKCDEDELIEQMFLAGHSRDETGKHTVSIPIKPTVQDIGSSRDKALRRFFSLERKFARDPSFKAEYVERMRENIEKGYMIEANANPKPGEMVYYIPHHDVHTTNKFRIVYDASCLTNKGVSLNDVQFVGPKLQRNLYETIMRFRRHKIAISADINSMYLQVRINKEQWNLQRVFWRENTSDPLKEWWLVVVTFGLSSSPYLAVRTMLEGAASMENDYPKAVHAIRNDFYMDDCTGSSDEQKAIQLAKDLKLVLGKSGFDLCKWHSNSEQLVRELEGEDSSVFFDKSNETAVLGLKWLTDSDEITYEVREPTMSKELTKRTILSKIGRLYDPNGFIAPIITLTKLLMRDLWNLKVDWDEQVPSEYQVEWRAIWNQILHLEKIRIPRWFGMSSDVQMQLHGFADASNKCYGCGVYVRVENLRGEIKCNLIASKSKIAPQLKQNKNGQWEGVSIPRLELAAAELLSSLFVVVRDAMELKGVPFRLWSDSSTALQWISKPEHDLKVFVANRVKKIREVSNENDWFHVRTHDNPADLISRGMLPSSIAENDLW